MSSPYTEFPTRRNEPTGMSTGALIGGILGAIVVAAFVIGMIFWSRKDNADKAAADAKKKAEEDAKAKAGYTSTFRRL